MKYWITTQQFFIAKWIRLTDKGVKLYLKG